MVREDGTDLVYLNENAKFNAVIDEIEELQAERAGRSSSARSRWRSPRSLSRAARDAGIATRSNAKFHEKESGIVSQAGRSAR